MDLCTWYRSLFDLPKRKKNLPATVEAIQAEIVAVAKSNKGKGDKSIATDNSKYIMYGVAVVGVILAVYSVRRFSSHGKLVALNLK